MNKIFYTIVLMLWAQISIAQDPIFSQFAQAPLYLNPGFTGLTTQQRIVANNRIQWPNLPQSFTTYTCSYDVRLEELNSGVGVMFVSDRIGSANWYTSTLTLFYSFSIRLSDKLILSPGLSYGYGVNGLDRTKLVLGDSIEFHGQSLDPALNRLGIDQYADFSSGIVLYTKVWWLGVSFNHLNRPNLSVINTVTALPVKTIITAGARFTIKHSSRLSRATYLTPSVIYQSQGVSSQLTFGVNYHIDPVFIGVSYRGKPYEKNQLNLANQDALIFQLGLLFKNFTVGYSYDFNTSPLASVSGGAHEISLTYLFQTVLPTSKSKKRSKLIPCPSNIQKHGIWK